MKLKNPLFSIIVIFYDGRKITEDCIKSILSTDFKNFEIILVDNGSKKEISNFFARKYRTNKFIKFVRLAKNKKVTGGYNFGASFAKGENLIFANNDLEFDKNWLKELSLVLKKNKNVILQPRVMTFDQKEINNCLGGKYFFPGFGISIGRGKEYSDKFSKISKIDYGCSICFMIGRKLYDKLGGFDESFGFYYEDVDLNLRAKKLGIESWYCPKSVIYHKESLTVRKKEDEKTLNVHVQNNQIKTIKKNFNGFERYLRLFFICIYRLTKFYQKLLLKIVDLV